MDVLVVDGYNIIGELEQLNRLKRQDLMMARSGLIDLLAEYKAFTGRRVIVVFDALYVKGRQSKAKEKNIEVIYTKEEETADECIERLVKRLKNVRNQVYVATSDYMEQRTIFSRGALRISARELLLDIESIEVDISERIERDYKRPITKIPIDKNVYEQLEKIRRRKK